MKRDSLLAKAKKIIRQKFGKAFYDQNVLFVKPGLLAQDAVLVLAQMYPRKEIKIEEHKQSLYPTFLEEYICTSMANHFNDTDVALPSHPIFQSLLKIELEFLFRKHIEWEPKPEEKKAYTFVTEMEKIYPDVKRSIYKSVFFVEKQR